jgi:uncharacterized membrane protein YcaP (DUF421 family)
MWHALPILADVSPVELKPSMWHPDLPWWEFIVRGVIIYAFLIILLRITGKRQVGQLAPFDLVLLLVLSNAVQNAMNGGDNSVTGGIVSATTLIVLNGVIGRLTFKSKKLEKIIEGRPDILIHNGKVYTDVLERQLLTHHELNAALRAAGCACPEEVHYAILENTGEITVQPRVRSASSAAPCPASASAQPPGKSGANA